MMQAFTRWRYLVLSRVKFGGSSGGSRPLRSPTLSLPASQTRGG